MDFSNAFDTFDHVILIKKLDHYGVKGRNLWFESYINNRRQFITHDNQIRLLLISHATSRTNTGAFIFFSLYK